MSPEFNEGGKGDPSIVEASKEEAWPTEGGLSDLFSRIADKYSTEGVTEETIRGTFRNHIRKEVRFNSKEKERVYETLPYTNLQIRGDRVTFRVLVPRGNREVLKECLLSFVPAKVNGQDVKVCQWASHTVGK